MDGKLLAFLIVLVVFGSMAFDSWMKRRSQGPSKQESEEREAQAKRIKQLEDRVATLERILTDKSERLRRDIDALDDEAA